MQNKSIIQSFEDVQGLFENVFLALAECSWTCEQCEKASNRRIAKLEKAIAELAAGQRELQAAVKVAACNLNKTRGEVRELQLKVDKLDREFRASIDQSRSEMESRFTNMELSMSRFRMDLNSYREEFKLLSDNFKGLKDSQQALSVSVKNLQSEMRSGFERLENKIDAESQRLENKMDAGFEKLDCKIDAESQRLENKMDAGFERLDRKMDDGFSKLGREIGRVGNSIGTFVEHFSIPSLRRIITSEYDVDFHAPFPYLDSKLRRRELDAFAFTKSENGNDLEAYLFEIKRKFEDKHIKQIKDNIIALRNGVSQFRHCPIYPYLLAASITKAQRQKVWNAGIHLITYGDKLFDLDMPPAEFKFDYQIGIQKKPQYPPQHRREVPTQHPPFYLMQLKRIGDSIKPDKRH